MSSDDKRDQQWGYGIPHIIAKGSRHEAVASAAIAGRKAPDADVLEMTQRVTHWHNQPPNRRMEQ